MSISVRARVALSSATALIALAATPALAQPTEASSSVSAAPEASSEDTAGTDIVVTARRREETLLDVPIAVTAFTGAQLEAQGALDITDISNSTPNVTLEVSRGSNTTLTAFIRGVGQQDPVSGFEQGVGIYLDDVYLNRPQAAVLDIYDVERIEVLRGPQGTLYGRNTVGGAVKYVTRRLSDDLELRLRGTYGTYDQAEGVATIGVPIGDAKVVRLGASLARLSRGGFGDNLTTGLENYNRDLWAGRVSLEVNNEDNVFVRFTGDYQKDKSDPRGGHRLIPSLFTAAPVLNDVYDTQGALNTPKQDIEAYGFSLFGEFKMSDLFTFRSITGLRRDNTRTPIDFDALPSADVDVPGIYRNKQFSQELQLLVSSDKLNGLLGGYFLDADGVTLFDVNLFTTVAGLAAFTNSTVHTETFAIFGDFTYDFTNQLSVSVGGRYTWDNRDARVFRQNYLGGGATVFGGAGIPFGAPSTDFRGGRNFKQFTPRASISFKPTPEHNIYASYSKGFKGGGFDPRGVGVNAPDLNGDGVRSNDEVGAFIGFDSEKVDSYEIGYKASLFDRRLSLALAGFRADYTDVQIPGSSGCVVNGVATFCGVTTNAGRARFQGFEAEATARIADGFRLSGTLGYIDAKFRRYITQIPGVGPTDVAAFRHVQNTPKLTASGTAAYSADLGSGRLDLTSTLSYRSKTYQFEIPNLFIDQKGYALLDASVVYHGPGDHWSIGVHGKNLTDKQYKTSGYTFLAINPTTGQLLTTAGGQFIPALGKEGILTAFYGNPRQVFVTGTIKF